MRTWNLLRDVGNYIGGQRRTLGKYGNGKALLSHFSCMY